MPFYRRFSYHDRSLLEAYISPWPDFAASTVADRIVELGIRETRILTIASNGILILLGTTDAKEARGRLSTRYQFLFKRAVRSTSHFGPLKSRLQTGLHMPEPHMYVGATWHALYVARTVDN